MKALSKKSGPIRITYCNKIQPIETFAESKSAINFKGFEALHNTVLDIYDQLLHSDVQLKLDICMMNCNDHLRHFSGTLTLTN